MHLVLNKNCECEKFNLSVNAKNNNKKMFITAGDVF